MNKYVKRGMDNFYKRNFSQAMFNFSMALSLNPTSKEARLGAILSDMASEKEEEATALFEYYIFAKESGEKNSEDVVEEIVDSVSSSIEEISSMLIEKEVETKINQENGIVYEDFIKLVSNRGSFKEAFEDIMFSTKVLISNKHDFIDFLDKLIDNGFVEMSLAYLESAIDLFPADEKLLSLIKKVK
ncbi:MAG: tetratricopeptide repeat protein [Sulfurospirillaceae bacterium]|nr:tetratricopeptide repeat protein [Sulfurospirillaceae bacterium]